MTGVGGAHTAFVNWGLQNQFNEKFNTKAKKK